MLDVEKYYDFIKSENVILSHRGSLDGDLIDGIIQLVDKRLDKYKTRTRIKKKVINILVECLQNSFNYTRKYQPEKNYEYLIESPFLILMKEEGNFIIFTGNYVAFDKVKLLKEKTKHLCTLSDEELRVYYIKNLNKDELPKEGGAGLGLVDIIRRSKHQVSFDFKEIDENYWLFTSLIKI